MHTWGFMSQDKQQNEKCLGEWSFEAKSPISGTNQKVGTGQHNILDFFNRNISKLSMANNCYHNNVFWAGVSKYSHSLNPNCDVSKYKST